MSIAATWRWLSHAAHGVSEVRVILPRDGLVGLGFFDREDAFVRACCRANVGANVYVGIQPRPRRFLARAPNVIRPRGRGARNEDIERLVGTVIDLDPVRPKGEAATDEELAAAVAAARRGAKWCEQQALLRPLLMMSGNGAQLWFAIPPTELPAGDREPMLFGLRAWEAEVRALLQSAQVRVDSIHDPARVIKVLGTVSFKGPGTPPRPHRVSTPLESFERREDPELARRLRETAPKLPLDVLPSTGGPPPPVRKRLPVAVPPAAAAVLAEPPVEMCAPIRSLWNHGAEDRSEALFNLIRYLAYQAVPLPRVIELVLAYDERVLGKLRGRDGDAYVRHAWAKICATRRADGVVAPPCHAMQKLGLCLVTVDPAARCQPYNLLFDLDAEIDQLSSDPATALLQMAPLLEVLVRASPPMQAKYLKALSRHCQLSSEELRRRMPPRSEAPK